MFRSSPQLSRRRIMLLPVDAGRDEGAASRGSPPCARLLLMLSATGLLLLVFAFHGVHADDRRVADAEPRQAQEFERRTQSIKALLGAYRNMAQDAGKVDQYDQFARHISMQLAQADKKYQSGDFASGRDILDRAYALVKDAIVQRREGKTLFNQRTEGEQYQIRQTRPSQVVNYERRLDSIDTLYAAYARVSQEKGRAGQASILAGNVSRIKSEANTLYDSGQFDRGTEMLNGAYALVKEALAALRQGDTLVQSLDFANQEEEYQYYLRKTHSQKTAIAMLLRINEDSAKIKVLQNLLASAEAMLDQAEALAEQRKFAEANPIMDKVFSRLQSGLMMSLSSP